MVTTLAFGIPSIVGFVSEPEEFTYPEANIYPLNTPLYFYLLTLFLLLICTLFCLPMFKLLQIQITNFVSGLTMNERYSKQKKPKAPNTYNQINGENSDSDYTTFSKMRAKFESDEKKSDKVSRMTKL